MGRIKVPERYQAILDRSKGHVGFMGLSVGKVNFENPEAMKAYSEFMQNNFLYGVFVIADFPKKYNIMALDGASEKTAEQRTQIAGDNLRNALEKTTRDFPRVKVARWKHFMDSLYGDNLEVLSKAYETEEGFQQACNHLVWEFLSLPANLARRNKSASLADCVAMSKNYVLDELALLVSAPFSFPLPVCEIYPGRNEVHEQVQERMYTFCKDLHIKSDRVFMEAYYESADKKD